MNPHQARIVCRSHSIAAVCQIFVPARLRTLSNIRTLALAVFCLALGIFASTPSLYAAPTGAPLAAYPVTPCRILDTRTSLGPLAAGTAMDVHVRGSALLASEGAGRADCDVPPEAQAVTVNITVIQPATNGYLKINRTGAVSGPHGPYSRVTYRALENDSNEIEIELCNVFIAPYPHGACGLDENGRYTDFQIYNAGPTGSSLHIVADVVAYLAQPPSETVVAGEVVDIQSGSGPDPFIELTLDNSLKIVCTLPWSDHTNCNAQIHDIVRAVGHINRFGDEIVIYAHGEVGITEPEP